MTVIDCPGNDGTKPILRLRAQEMAKEDLDRINGLLAWMDGGTRFRYELDVAYHAHYYEVEDGEPVSCARIQVSTIIDEANLVVTLVDQTAPSCPASKTRKALRKSGAKELLNRHVNILQSDNEVLNVSSVQMAVRDGFLVVTGTIIRLDATTAAMAVTPRENRPRTVIAVQTVDL